MIMSRTPFGAIEQLNKRCVCLFRGCMLPPCVYPHESVCNSKERIEGINHYTITRGREVGRHMTEERETKKMEMEYSLAPVFLADLIMFLLT